MAYKQLSRLDFSVRAAAGACLVQAQNVVGAGGGPYSATVAANATRFRHKGGKLPRDAAAVVWFSHWGTYTDYRNGERRYEDWGHVVIWWPNAFEGRGGYYSSPASGTGGLWLETIAEVERTFSSKYRFWSEDINGVRVCAPLEPVLDPTQELAPLPIPEEKRRKIDMIGIMIADGENRYKKGKNKKYYATWDGRALVSLTEEDANAISVHMGEPFAVVSYAAWEAYKRASEVMV